MSSLTIICRVIKCTKCRVYHIYALQIANTSESDPHSYEGTTEVAKKAQKKLCGFNGIQTHDLHDTGAMLYRLSYEASPEAGQE